MKDATAFIIFLVAVTLAGLMFFGGDSFSRLSSLRKSLELQQRETKKTEDRVMSLRREVNGLQSDERVLEKTARDELGLARQGELIFLFDSHVASSDQE